jgi:hypothetical protein
MRASYRILAGSSNKKPPPMNEGGSYVLYHGVGSDDLSQSLKIVRIIVPGPDRVQKKINDDVYEVASVVMYENRAG